MKTDFYGRPALRLENAHLRLEFLAEAGPRIVRLSRVGTEENLLAEVPDFIIRTALGKNHLLGGHRLWHAPEASPRTYLPDDAGLEVEQFPGGARLLQPVEAQTGIRKEMEVRLHADLPAVTVLHRLRNLGLWDVELAPWALTALPLGGVAVFPQPAAPAEGGLLPNRRFALWPYSRWSDPRVSWGDDFVLLRARAVLPPFKFGYLNEHGWIGYWRGGVFLRKRFDLPGAETYPDFGCNVECYCGDRFIELETLGPLARLRPGAAVEHTETWELESSPPLPLA